MRAGALRNAITIQKRVETGKDNLNNPVYSWTTWRDVLCEKLNRRATEPFSDKTKQRFSQAYTRFRCRYDDVDGLSDLPGVDTTMQILHEGKTYRITAVLPDDQRRVDCLIDAVLIDGAV